MTYRHAYRIIVFLVILLYPVLSLSSLELTEDGMKLTLHESSGRFSLHYLSDVSKERYTSLFAEKDPRTTSLGILFANEEYRMGDSPPLSQEVFRTDSSAGFLWTYEYFSVKQEFSFIRSEDSSATDGISIRITIRNFSDTDQCIGARLILDTWLGERRKPHFKTDIHEAINAESSFAGRETSYIVSGDPLPAGKPAIQIMTRANGVTTPDKVILGNLGRLTMTASFLDTKQGRSFTMFPHSINDSAVSLMYLPQSLKPKESREIILRMGQVSEKGFGSAAGRDMAAGTAPPAGIGAVTPEPTGTQVEMLATDLLAVNDLIRQIDRKLESGTDVDETELAVLRKALEDMSRRKYLYEY